MLPRLAVSAIVVFALAVGACGGSTPMASPSLRAPATTTVPLATPVPAIVPATPAPKPVQRPVVGAVDGDADGPMLTVEPMDDDTVIATISDPDAKAWRISVAGTGGLGGDRWDIVVETGDVGPVVSATEVHDGKVVDVLDLTPFRGGGGAAGGCHSTLPVCIDSDSFEIPEGDGLFSVRLELTEGQVPLVIRGAAASWPGEPFVLGPWVETEAFPWGEG